MSRSINLDAAVDVVAKWFENMGLNGDICLDGLRSLPSAQPEIIYCKECVCGHCEVWLCGNGSTDVYGYCGRTNFRVLPYDYCSRAERRENG